MAKKKTVQKDSNTGVALGLAGLAVAGIAGAYLFYGKDGAKNRKKVKTWTLRAKADILEKLEKAKEVSEETFHNVVDEISAKYGEKIKDINPADVLLFTKEIKKHWKDIKSELTPAPKKIAKKIAK
jgi:gas vesicle protein